MLGAGPAPLRDLVVTWSAEPGGRPAFSPSGTLLAMVHDSGYLEVREALSGRLRSASRDHAAQAARSTLFTADGRTLMSFTGRATDEALEVRHVGTGRRVAGGSIGTRGLGVGTATKVAAVSPDGSLVVFGELGGRRDTGMIHLVRVVPSGWHTRPSARSLPPPMVLMSRGLPGGVTAAAFSPDERLLVAAGRRYGQGRLWLWEVSSGRLTAEAVVDCGAVTDVVFAPEGRMLAAVGADQTIRYWDVAARAMSATVALFAGGGHAVLLPDGSHQVVGRPEGALWWTAKLRRFGPGELDGLLPVGSRLDPDQQIPALAHFPARARSAAGSGAAAAALVGPASLLRSPLLWRAAASRPRRPAWDGRAHRGRRARATG